MFSHAISGTIKLIRDVTSTQADRGVNEEGCNRSYSHNNPVAKWAEKAAIRG
jgi:hypothetical protein